MRRRSKRWQPRKQFRGCSSLVELPVFTRKDRVRFPAAPYYGVLTQLGSVPDSYSGSSGFDSLAPHIMSPRSSAELEHLATDQGVVGSNPTAEVSRVVSSVDSEHVASTHGVGGSNPPRPVGKLWAVSSARESRCLTSTRPQVRSLHCPLRGSGSKVERLLAEQQVRVRFSSSACAGIAHVGRASGFQPDCRRFDSDCPLLLARGSGVARPADNRKVVGSNPTGPMETT